MERIKTIQKEKKIQKEKLSGGLMSLTPRLIGVIADEISKTLLERLPAILPHRRQKKKKIQRIENAVFLDTSAIIDRRVFEVIKLKVLTGIFVVLETILLELKHIADAKDSVKKEKGRKGLESLEKLKKTKGVKFIILPNGSAMRNDKKEADEELIYAAKQHYGRIATCDYNLEKKASISGVIAININTLANSLKIIAIPGEILDVNILHRGKDITQGVGYLDDGTMLVVENGSENLGEKIKIVISRVIQTTAGRILFAKKI